MNDQDIKWHNISTTANPNLSVHYLNMYVCKIKHILNQAEMNVLN
jgi:hypothetical protein